MCMVVIYLEFERQAIVFKESTEPETSGPKEDQNLYWSCHLLSRNSSLLFNIKTVFI